MKCKDMKCKELIDDDYDLCQSCREKKMYNFDLAMKYGKENKTQIEMNTFILEVFNYNVEQIERVLMREIVENTTLTISDYDKFWAGKEEELCSLKTNE